MTIVKYDKILGALRESDEPQQAITRQVLGTNVLTDDMLRYSGVVVIKEEDWLDFEGKEPNAPNFASNSKFVKLKYFDNGELKDIPASLGFSYSGDYIGAALDLDGVYAPLGNTSVLLVSDFDNASGLYTFFVKSGFISSSPVIKAHSLLIQPDEKIIVVGEFKAYQRKTANNIIRLLPDGSIDSSFNSGTGFNQIVRSAALLPSGKIICVGDFTTYNDIPAQWIVALNPDGSIDSSFTSNLGTGFFGNSNGYLKKISYKAGALYVSGYFFELNEVRSERFVRIATDGTPDASFNTNIGEIVIDHYDFDVYPDGKTVHVGMFDISGTKNAMILNADGTRDTSFIPFVQLGLSKVCILNSGDILYGGTFSNWGGASIAILAKSSITGVQNTEWKFSGFTIQSSLTNVDLLSQRSDGKIILTSDASFLSTITHKSGYSLMILNEDGSLDETNDYPLISNGSNPRSIPIVKYLPNGKFYLGGCFNSIKSRSMNVVARLNSDLTLDTFSGYPWLNSFTTLALLEIDGVLCLTTSANMGLCIVDITVMQQYGTGYSAFSSGVSS